MAKIEHETTGIPDERRTDADDRAPRDDTTARDHDAAAREATEVRDHDDDDGVMRLPSLSRLKGMDVRDAEGEKVGSIKDVYLEPSAEHVRYLSVSTGWLSRGTHVVPIDDVTYLDEGDGRDAHAVVPYSTDHLKGAPSLDDDGEVTPEREREIRGYYDGADRWDAERVALRARQRTPAPTPQIAQAEMADSVNRDADRQSADRS